MQENISSKNTKLKVIGGYSLLFLLSVLSAVLIYRQITKLVGNEEAGSDATGKLFIVSGTVTNLYKAETLSNAFIQTGASRYFRQYTALLEETGRSIDSLSRMTIRPEQLARLDSIHTLLGSKWRNLQDLVYVKRTFVPEDFYNKAIASIESDRDSLPRELQIRPRYVTTFDSTYVKTERKRRRWFAKAETDSVLNVTQSFHIVYDTLEYAGGFPLRNTDTVVNILRTTWQDVQRQSEDLNRQISRREHALIRQSTEISDKLKRILGEYEKEEISHAAAKQANREQTVKAMMRIFAAAVAGTFLLVVFFTFFIFRDLSRSQRYRRELESANRYADQLLKSRERLILTVTHDIKSPLSSVLGYIELLENTPVNERQRYFLKNMQGSSNHILQLVGNLLDLSKLENNKMQVEEVVFNPARLFREIVDNFLPLAANKQLELQGKWGKDLDGDFKGDALRIRQIVTNLLSNAVKYTAEGIVRFSAATSTDDKRIVLRIEDTGSGMTPEEQRYIFEEFSRLKSHAGIEGTGLGLTITLRLIHLLGGELKVESTPGKGSTFTVFLPMQKAPAKSPADPPKGDAFPREPESSPRGPVPLRESLPSPSPSPCLKVLLVDDDPLQLAMTAELLSRYGIQAATTTDPREVIARLQAERYDLLFSDIQMPWMNGFELVKAIRALPDAFAHTLPVVALSADFDKGEETYLRAGFSAYLAKPFRTGQLIALVARLTGREIGLPAASAPPKGRPARGYTLENIRRFTDNDPDALRSILQSFASTTTGHILQLRRFRAAGQWQEIAALAHKMLPMFRQLETDGIVRMLEQLEHPEKTNLSEEDADKLVVQFCTEAEALLIAIR